MKKAIIISVFAALSLGLFGCEAGGSSASSSEKSSKPAATVPAASEETSEPSSEETPEGAAEKATETQPVVTEEPETEAEAPTEASPASSEDWKAAYKKVLNDFAATEDYVENESAWDLRDLDGDGVPELLISQGSFHVSGVDFYRYESGEAKPIAYDNGGNFRYGVYGSALICPEEKLIGTANTHMGIDFTDYYRYEDGVVCYVQSTSSDAGSAGPENAIYAVNNQDVDKETYDKALSEFQSKNWVEAGSKYSFSDFSALD